MYQEILYALFLPLLGTSLGAAFVFFLKNRMGSLLRRSLNGFAAGVMTAASVWSLIIPAIEQSEHLGILSFLPAAIGVWSGILFLLLLDHLIPHLSQNRRAGDSTMMVLAVALHNLPEGMAVGVAAAGRLLGTEAISAAALLALSTGIALQNLPEGAIVSMPLRSGGMRRGKAFGCGVASGIIEPIGAAITIFLANLVIPILPYLLAFAAGAMLYVVAEELMADISGGRCPHIGTLFFAAGFTLMMALDVAFG